MWPAIAGIEKHLLTRYKSLANGSHLGSEGLEMLFQNLIAARIVKSRYGSVDKVQRLPDVAIQEVPVGLCTVWLDIK